ncbi:MAG: Do family serine endopeptidase [Acidobacteria bacterium]|nr:Do family serine endopeptidase [Acidobacteriota bacterium]
MKQKQMGAFSLAAIVVAAVLFGMVLSGGLNLTTRANAGRTAQVQAPAASTAPRVAPDFADLAARVVPSVVSVFAKDVIKPGSQRAGRRGMPQDPFHFFFGPFFGPNRQQGPIVQRSAGSGFFISPDGEILTNNHVVANATELEIETTGGDRYSVKVVGRDPATDIAVIRIKKPDRKYPALKLGDSDAARQGEWVMAVGNPLNMPHTVTVGVVSAKGRVLGISDTSFENFIQTDAAINPGNSGGPLVDLRGEVIGINTAISAQGQNIGFAVPINTVKLILPQLESHGKVVRGYLGVTVRNINEEIQKAFGLKDRKGALIEEVLPGHAADKAGLKHGDVVIGINGHPITDTRVLIDRVSATPPGKTVRLKVLRNGKALTIPVKLEERKIDESGRGKGHSSNATPESVSERVGITVAPLTPDVRQYFGIDNNVKGVVVTKVNPISPAADAGLGRGDVITEVDGHSIGSVDQLKGAVAKVKKGGYLRLYVMRPKAGRSFYAILKLVK